ncbi:hypothetical protein GINT2_001621 [Glugoides intestinalis]
MTMMVSSYNNTQKVIYLWQKLIWSNQPGALLSTVLFIEISIAILFIITLLKEEKEKYYYNNLSNSCLTILLTIISGFIFGKGVEILFRTLHICSGAYGNVVFSLNDIFISLLFGCIFVISGYCLLFNKKLRELLRLQKSEYAKLKEIMADNKAPIEDRLEAMKAYFKLKIRYGTEEEGSKHQEIWIEINKKVDSFKKIMAEKEATVDSLENNAKSFEELRSELEKKVNEVEKVNMDELEAARKGIEAARKRIDDRLNEYNAAKKPR